MLHNLKRLTVGLVQQDVLEIEPSTRWGWNEKLLALYGIVVLFCIIAIPRLGVTILSYFTEEVMLSRVQ